ncbi:ICP0-binding domain of ubiquitin-specific protease 7-domain-containing protein [Pisolithus marmoratus]|nr:ICP0-binding domain of ubiquitin-specific protease 7-domain-containing protein [Pisolithus marmoratus]
MAPVSQVVDNVVSVHDHNAFAAKHLPDLGHDVKDFQVYTWRVTNWDKLKMTSPKFDCGGHKWSVPWLPTDRRLLNIKCIPRRILWSPSRYSDDPSSRNISVYLDYAEPNKSPEGWHTCAQFALVISNIHDPTIYAVGCASYRFTAEQCHWGFTRFRKLRQLSNVQEGHLRPIIEEDSADVTAYLEANRKRKEERLFLTARVITDDTFARHEGFDLATFDEKNYWPQLDLPTFRVLKQETYSVFKSRVAAHFELPVDKVRLWVLIIRQNKTVRPDTLISENDPSLTVEAIRSKMAADRKDLRLYLDVITGPIKPFPPPGHVMVFLKHFDTSKQTLLGIGKVYVRRNSKVQDLHPIINGRMRWSPAAPLRYYEEIRPSRIELRKPKLTFTQSDIQDGDIICFQIEQAETELHDLEIQGLYANPINFYGFLQNRVMIFFRPKFEEPNSDHPKFSLVLSKKYRYDTMCQRASEYLRHDPMKLRFTTTHAANGDPKAILKRSLNQSIEEFMGLSYVSPTKTVILYEKLDISAVELDTKRNP